MVNHYRTAPSLLQELLSYDPRPRDPPPSPPAPCRHAYSTIDRRSKTPQIRDSLAHDTGWIVNVLCQLCHCHIALILTFPTQPLQPCPSQHFPLHHFHLTRNGVFFGGDHELFFSCTVPICKAELVVHLRPPTLSDDDVRLLTDPLALKARSNSIRERYPDKADVTAIEALKTFRSYVSHSVENEEDRGIPSENHKFKAALGTNASKLLNRLGFSYEPHDANERSLAHWYLPKPALRGDEVLKTKLEDVVDELTALMQQCPDAEKKLVNESLMPPPPDTQHLERILGSFDYEKVLFPIHAAQVQAVSSDSNLSAFQTIGALPDFADKLVDYAYDRQAIWDPANGPRYLQALKDIASSRSSESLQTKVVLLESQGQMTQGALDEACGYFKIEQSHIKELNDEHVLGRFNVLYEDCGPAEKTKAREMLNRIGIAKSSARLQAVASQSIETYEEALAFLYPDASHATDDEFILTLARSKINENQDSIEITRKAVDIIAHNRDSQQLRNWLESSSSHDTNLQEAYLLLGIESDNPSRIDDDTVLHSYLSRTMEPSNDDRMRQIKEAFTTIADRRASTSLKHAVQQFSDAAPGLSRPKMSLNDPRGIRNIGNTCYLNSLLQYFFTVKPVRYLVEDFERYKQETNPNSRLYKRVGEDRISQSQVQRAQNFVEELETLFQSLIAAHEDFVAPREELARLTLRPVVSQTTRSRSLTFSESNPGSGQILTSPNKKAFAKRNENGVLDGVEDAIENPESSQTSIKAPVILADQVENTKELARGPDESIGDGTKHPMNGKAHTVSSNTDLTPTPEEIKNEGLDMTEEPMDVDDHGKSHEKTRTPSSPTRTDAPSKPPPIPPRPGEKNSRAEYEEFAQQQDVQEVIENVLYLLRWAIKPESFEQDGEQIDLISRTFFGKNNYTTSRSGRKETKLAPFCYLILYLKGCCDMYGAMDDTWDKSEIRGSTDVFQFNTLEEIPPVLQFYVPRVQFDREKQVPFKAMHQLKLQDIIYMDRYMDNEDMIRRRERSWELKAQLGELRARQERLRSEDLDLSFPQALDAMRQYLADLKTMSHAEVGELSELVDDALLQQISRVSKRAAEEIESLKGQIELHEAELRKLFDAGGQLGYRLHAVFVHVGRATGGHWFIFIRDAESGAWRKYNDENIAIFSDTSEIYEPDPERNGTSAFVVYVSEKHHKELIETVCRIPAPEAEFQSEDPEPAIEETGDELGASDSGPVGEWDNTSAPGSW